jgi:hypothetical protein
LPLDYLAGEEGARARKATVRSYREFILELAIKTPLGVWYTRMEIDQRSAIAM